jgi:hypothetical protein
MLEVEAPFPYSFGADLHVLVCDGVLDVVERAGEMTLEVCPDNCDCRHEWDDATESWVRVR